MQKTTTFLEILEISTLENKNYQQLLRYKAKCICLLNKNVPLGKIFTRVRRMPILRLCSCCKPKNINTCAKKQNGFVYPTRVYQLVTFSSYTFALVANQNISTLALKSKLDLFTQQVVTSYLRINAREKFPCCFSVEDSNSFVQHKYTT